MVIPVVGCGGIIASCNDAIRGDASGDGSTCGSSPNTGDANCDGCMQENCFVSHTFVFGGPVDVNSCTYKPVEMEICFMA